MSREMELGIRITADGRVLVSESGKAVAALKGIEAQTQKIAQSGERMATSLAAKIGHYGTALYALKQGYDAVSGAAHSAFETINQFEKLKGQLVTLTGSAEKAGVAFSALEKFAATTPYTLDQSVQAFARLKALGLESTERGLRSFGNTASAMGKDLMQFVEAVADATTGEFERLKEFGIKASAEGDKVKFTFQGVTTEVRKDAAAIADYLRSIGEVKFGDAMQRQMEGLPGVLSNLEDSVAALWRTLGDSGATSTMVEGLKTLTNVAQGAAEQYLEMAIAWNRSQDSVFSGIARLLNEVGASGAALHFAQAAAEQRQDARDLQAQLDKLTDSAGNSGAALAELGKVQIIGTAITRDHTAARRHEAAAMKEQEARERALQSSLKGEQDTRDELHDVFRSVMTEREKIQDDEKTRLAEINTAYEKAAEAGLAVEMDKNEVIQRLRTQTADKLKDLDESGLKRQEETADSFTETWKNAVKRLDDVFANFWKGLLSGSGDFMGSLKSLLTDFAAEFLHNTFTRPLTNLFSGGGTAAGAPSGVFSLLGSLFGFGSGTLPATVHDPFGGIGPLLPNSVASARGISLLDAANGGMALSSLFGSFPFSDTLGGFGARVGGFLGMGASGMDFLANGLGYSPWGALGGLAASLMGINGGLPGMALGTLGSIAGGALGGGISGSLGGIAMGSVMGPIGAILGALGGTFLGSLFGGKPKIPKASATYSLSATNLKTLTDSMRKNKGPLEAMKNGASQLIGALSSLEDEFDIEFGRASATMSSKGKKGRFSVSALGHTFQTGKYKLKDQATIDQLFQDMQFWALRRASKQIDDPALKRSIAIRSSVDAVRQDRKAIHDIRLFTGEASQLKDTMETLAKTFARLRGTASQLGMDLKKLHEGWARALTAQRDDLDTKITALLGQEADPEIARRAKANEARDLYRQALDFNAAIDKENSAAKRKLAALKQDMAGFGYLNPQNARQELLAGLWGQMNKLGRIDLSKAGGGDPFNAAAQKLAKGLRGAGYGHLANFTRTLHAGDAGLKDALPGKMTEAQFIADALKTLEKALDDANPTLQTAIQGLKGLDDILDDLTGKLPKTVDELKKALSGETDPDKRLDLIGRLSAAALNRYRDELSAIALARDASIALWTGVSKTLRSYLDDLNVSALSPLSPEDRLREAQGQYGRQLLLAQAGNVDALGSLTQYASRYLDESRGYYASGSGYVGAFESVRAAMDQLARKGEEQIKNETARLEYDKKQAELLASTVKELEALKALLQQIRDTSKTQADRLTGLEAEARLKNAA